MAIHSRAPGRLSAVMSVDRVGDFELEAFTWSSDTMVLTRRTERLIRVSDPGFYRLILSISTELHVEQAGNRVALRGRDMGLFDLSCPVRSAQLPGPGRCGWSCSPSREPRCRFPVTGSDR